MKSLLRNRVARWAVLAVVVAGLVVGSYLVGVSDGDDSDQVRALNGKLAAARQETSSEADRADEAESKADDLDTQLADAQDEIKKVTGAEESIADPASGLNAKITSKGKTIKLEEMAATLLGHTVSDTISTDIDTVRAEGSYVTVTVRLENRTNSPQTPPEDDAYLLEIGGQQFNANFDAMNLPGQSFTWKDDPISPGSARTGTITFDVSSRAAKNAASGTVFIPQFSDASSFDEGPSLPVAGLKLQ
jgi:Domain of unknown function (DUF4352)